MNKKIFKIIIIMMVILAIIIIGIMYLIDLDRMKNGKAVVFSTWGAKYAPIEVNKVSENDIKLNTNSAEDYQKYSKTIDNTKIELNIPRKWNYEEIPINEESPSYKYALKLYKNDESKYAMLYFYNDKFGICGTGRTSENIILNNGNQATIGYYDGDKNWSDISFFNTYEYIVVLNCGLEENIAKEVIEFIKTINIIN